MKNQFLLAAFIILSNSCTQIAENKISQLVTNSGNTDFILNKRFNLEIRPDTTTSWYMIDNPHSYSWQIKNDTAIVLVSDNLAVLEVKDSLRSYVRRLWPSNLPSFLKHRDTIIISGNVFSLGKAETGPGLPVILTRIYAHTFYKMADLDKK